MIAFLSLEDRGLRYICAIELIASKLWSTHPQEPARYLSLLIDFAVKNYFEYLSFYFTGSTAHCGFVFCSPLVGL